MRVLRYGVLALIVGAASCETNQLTDNSLPLEAPNSLSSVSLNAAIALSWSDNAYQNDPNRFDSYRVYSTSYDLDSGFCGTSWSVEGTTVAPEFVAGALTNGVPRCYGVTPLGVDGTESDPSPLRQGTPRPDPPHVLGDAYPVDSLPAGFRLLGD